MAYNTTVTDFENVYKEYYIRLYRYAFSFLNDADASKDIVADVFSKYWKEHHHILHESLSGYLFVSVRNACMSHIRRVYSKERYIIYSKTASEEDNGEYFELMEERIDEMNLVIEQMPERTQFVIKECYLNGHTYKEVAEMTGITTDGVKKHVMKAFAMLREHFNVKKR